MMKKNKDELQHIQETIKCLEAVRERLRHRPEDKKITEEINEVIVHLNDLLQNASKRKDKEKIFWFLKAISILKMIKNFITDNFLD